MHRILYYADPHFFDPSIINHCPHTRGMFSSVADMNEFLVETHNAHVDKHTDVYILGDFARRADEREVRKIFEKLNGSKHLIIGNHDDDAVLRQKWSTRRFNHMVKDSGHRIYLNHEPVASWTGLHRGVHHFHGHTHAKFHSAGRYVDVGLDAWDMRPVTALEAIDRMIRRNPDYDTFIPENEEPILRDEDNFKDAPYVPKLYDPDTGFTVEAEVDFVDENDHALDSAPSPIGFR